MAADHEAVANPQDKFVSWAIDYHVTGTRSWPELSTAEQDQYLLACFKGDARRAEAEKRLGLFDRAANSVAQHLLGVYHQYDIDNGVARYEPPTPRVAAGVLERRRRVLAGTDLGARLDAALDRAEGKHVESAGPELKFYSVAPAALGMEVLDERCSDDTGWTVPHGFDQWNNFDVLDRLHYQHTSRTWQKQQEENFDRALHESRVQFDANQNSPPVPVAEELGQPTEASAPLSNIGRPSNSVYLLAGAAVGVLAGAFVDGNPSWYFLLLRLIVSGCLAWLTLRALTNEMQKWAMTLAVGAMLYNPLVPLHLGRATWQPVNICTSVVIVAFSVLLWRRERSMS